jgi:hypothetical protein
VAISRELLELLVCPKCREKVRLSENGDGLICDRCRLLYEIRDGIPVMLIGEAKKLS